MTLNQYRSLFIQTCLEWVDDKAPHMTVSLAFYSMLSLGPLLLLVLAAASLLFGHDAAQGRIVDEIRDLIGDDGARAIQDMILDSARRKATGLVTGVIGLGTLLLGASGVFGALQDAMNTIWDVRPRPGRGIRGFLHDRLLSFTMVLGTSFLLLVSLVVSAALSALNDWSAAYTGYIGLLMGGLNFIVSFGVISFLFSVIFKYIPDVRIGWRDVLPGAIMTAFLFTLGKTAIGFYIGHSAFNSAYGAAGSLVVVLLWVYYSAQILFFGAEFTQVYTKRSGRDIRPRSYAMKINAKP